MAAGRWCGIDPHIARRGVDSRERFGRHRWTVEGILARFGQFRRLAVRDERRADVHRAFLALALALFTHHFVRCWSC